MCGLAFQVGQTLRVFMLHVNFNQTAPVTEGTEGSE